VRKKKTNGTTIRIDRERFAQELIIHSMNATDAYMALCPTVKRTTAAANGSRLLREAETLEFLKPMLEKLFVKAGVEAEYVLSRFLEMAQATPLDYFEIDEAGGLGRLNLNGLTDSQRLNLKEIKVERTAVEKESPDGSIVFQVVNEKINIKVHDAQKALEILARHLGLLVERLAEEDISKIGDIIERGVKRIKQSKNLDAWEDIILDVEYKEIG
jgi:phage terminase small subunit